MRLVVALSVLIACSPEALGQTDGFRARIPEGCKTESSCEQMVAEARRRTTICEPNTIGHIRCSDAESDLNDVRVRLARLQEKRQAEDFAANEKAYRAMAERSEQERKARDQEAVARALIGKRQSDMRWSLRECENLMTTTPCDRLEAYGHEHAVQCLTDCALAIETSKKRAYKRAISECVDAMVETLGKAKPDCHFLLPSTATDDMADRRDACAGECLEQAKPLVTRARQSVPSGNASSPRGGVARALCCDGTPSPSCACPGHQGCCSHHGGVCGCTQ